MTNKERRLQLHKELENILGNKNVYFQPPENIKLKYPCIIYERDRGYASHADDSVYIIRIRYQITVIDKDPDSEIFMKVAKMRGASYDTHFNSDNLSHDVITLYY